MTRIHALCLAALMWAGCPLEAGAWPVALYPEIFLDARQTLPASLQQLLEDMEPVLSQGCRVTSVQEATREAIIRFSDPTGDLPAAVAALRDAGCAAAAMNDPSMDSLVESYRSRFAVVFYGWHPAIQDGDLEAYLTLRQAEVDTLAVRLEQSADLPSRSDMVELSPEFGMASIAYSHAVTDVANVWLYIWDSINGAV